MAPKKQTKKAAPRKLRAAKFDVETFLRDEFLGVNQRFDTQLRGLEQFNDRLGRLEQLMLPPVVPSEMLEGKDRVQAGEVTVIPPAPVTQLVAGIRGIEEAVVLIAERMQTIVELQLAKPPSKPRGKKASEPVAEGEGIKNNDVVDQGAPLVEDPTSSNPTATPAEPGTIPEAGEKRKVDPAPVVEETKPEPVKETPKLAVVPAPAAETKAEEIPFETVRAKAVEYAQKHTKAKLKEVLATFVPGPDPKLSGIIDRAAFLKALEA